MAKAPMSITKLRIKIDSHDSGDLPRIAELCRMARNSAVENWLLRMRGLSLSESQATRKGGPVTKRNGEPIDHDATKSESALIYNFICDTVQEIGTPTASLIASSISTHLGAKVDWRKRGKLAATMPENFKAPKRSDAILNYHDRPPFFTGMQIPTRGKESSIDHDGDGAYVLSVRGVTRRKDAVGRTVPGESLRFTLRTGALPVSKRRILSEISSGDMRCPDGCILMKDDGDWYWDIAIKRQAVLLDNGVSAILAPVMPKPDSHNSQLDRPYVLELPNARDWYIGDGRYLKAQMTRLTGLRKQIGWRYRNGNGAGHGRSKIDAAIGKRIHQARNICDEVRRRMIRDVIEQCKRNRIGTLIYREPTDPVKGKCWFESNGLEWDWTRFASDLKNQCMRAGVTFETNKLKMAEVIGIFSENDHE